MSEIQSVTDLKNILGEVPVWCPAERRLYWVDIRQPAVHRLDPESGKVETWTMPEMVGALALRETGGLLLALKSRMAFFDLESGAFEDLFKLPADQPFHRFNDGRCDPRGRFVAGTMKDTSRIVDGFVQGGPATDPEGVLYVLDEKLEVRELFGGIIIPNSLAWSPDARTMYFADSRLLTIFAYGYDPESGALGARRPFARTDDRPGVPDGATVDREGFLWSAQYGGWQVIRYAPDGRVDRVIDLPVEQPTACTFGGPGLDRLYITTATQRLPAEQLAKQPLAGTLLAIDVGVRGLPEPRFAG